MHETENESLKVTLIFIGFFILAFFIIGFQVSSQNQTNSASIVMIFFVLILVFLIVPLFSYFGFKGAIHSIDMFILRIPYFKINNQTFYCQVCKEEVHSEDDFCSNCGMML